jgi:hypothetical protein
MTVTDAYLVYKARLNESHPDVSISMVDFRDRLTLAMLHNQDGEAELPVLTRAGRRGTLELLSLEPPLLKGEVPVRLWNGKTKSKFPQLRLHVHLGVIDLPFCSFGSSK